MPIRQSAAIPYRFTDAGQLEVLLVTSRRRGRWVLPKGKVKRWMMPHVSAAHEAFEEGGVLGVIERSPVGIYRQHKLSHDGRNAEIAIQAFAMLVNTELQRWPEDAARRRRWMRIDEAVEAVRDHGLKLILQRFETAASEAVDTNIVANS